MECIHNGINWPLNVYIPWYEQLDVNIPKVSSIKVKVGVAFNSQSIFNNPCVDLNAYILKSNLNPGADFTKGLRLSQVFG